MVSFLISILSKRLSQLFWDSYLHQGRLFAGLSVSPSLDVTFLPNIGGDRLLAAHVSKTQIYVTLHQRWKCPMICSGFSFAEDM